MCAFVPYRFVLSLFLSVSFVFFFSKVQNRVTHSPVDIVLHTEFACCTPPLHFFFLFLVATLRSVSIRNIFLLFNESILPVATFYELLMPYSFVYVQYCFAACHFHSSFLFHLVPISPWRAIVIHSNARCANVINFDSVWCCWMWMWKRRVGK